MAVYNNYSFQFLVSATLLIMSTTTMLHAAASDPVILCNNQVDAALTPCVRTVANDVVGKRAYPGHPVTSQCKVNETTVVNGGASCDSGSSRPCLRCVRDAGKEVIAGCPDRAGGQITGFRGICTFRYEIYDW